MSSTSNTSRRGGGATTPRKDESDSLTTEDKEQAEVLTSMRVFRRYLTTARDGTVDASQIVSKACFETWLQTRRHLPADAQKAFHRTLCAHVSGMDGRTPFTREEENAILKIVRLKQVWPCFKEEGVTTGYGLNGLRSRGWHEKQQDEIDANARSTLSYDVNAPSSRTVGQVMLPISKRTRRSSASAAATVESSGGSCTSSSAAGTPSQSIPFPALSQPTWARYLSNEPVLPVPISPRSLPIPDTPVVPNDDIAGSPPLLLVLVQQILTRVGHLTANVTNTLFSMMRMSLISQGMFMLPTMELANRAMREALVEADLTREGVLVMNLLTRTPQHRVMMQTSNTIPLVGRITAVDGGIDHMIIPFSEILKVLAVGIRAFHDPSNGWNSTSLLVNLINGTQMQAIASFRPFYGENRGQILLVARFRIPDHFPSMPLTQPIVLG